MMTSLRFTSLRARLTASYVAALVLAMLMFGGAAVAIIHREQYASVDAGLRTTTQAALNFIDVDTGDIRMDSEDNRQLLALIGPQANLAVFDASGKLGFAAGATPRTELFAATPAKETLSNLGHGDTELRAFVKPLFHDGRLAGTVKAWTTVGWIAQGDRRVAIAFAAAALLLALVASVTSTAVTRRALDAAWQRQHRFAADASHDLRAPLSVIRAEADLALRAPREPAAYQAALTTIAAEADQMERLVSTLLSAARSQEDQQARTMFDVSELVKRVCAHLRPAASAKQMDILLRPCEGSTVCANADALERAVTAVLHNAIKYASAGGSIDVSVARRRKNVELSVRDDGQGFSPAAIAHGVEWFWSGEHSIDAGSGLGLAIANAIVKGNRGRLVLANATKGGGQVTITLPSR